MEINSKFFEQKILLIIGLGSPQMRRTVDSPGEVQHNHAPCEVRSQKRVKPVLVPEVNGNNRG